jgi:hypothetical protein
MTTQKGVAPAQQLLVDAFNHDQIAEALEDGYTFSEEDNARQAELAEKTKHHARLTRELAERAREAQAAKKG